MPKLKTNKTATKRIVKITATGKYLRRKTLAQHLVHRKSQRTIKSSGECIELNPTQTKTMKKLIPYRKK
jgi:ribosomal protein L35